MIGGHPGGTVSQVYAIVEFADGTVKRVQPYDVQFIDEDKKKSEEKMIDDIAFGKFLRAYRIQAGLLLYDMAKDLGVGSAFLSGCETGRHPIPEEWKEKLPELYSDLDKAQLQRIIDTCNKKRYEEWM